MSAASSIEWTEATWSPIRGCTRIASGCVNCYAERMMARGLPSLNSPTTGNPFAVMTPSGPRWTGEVELIESMLDVPLHWRRPRRIFVNSISDTFHKDVPDEWIDNIIGIIWATPRHQYFVLTKRVQRAAELLPRLYAKWDKQELDAETAADCAGRSFGRSPEFPPSNLWIGASASTRPDLDAQIEHLRATPAVVRFLSLEPLIADLGTIDLSGIGWVIVGGESGPGARPCQVEWVRSVVQQCTAASKPCFVKQLGSNPVGRWSHHNQKYIDPKGGDPAEWPIDLRVREMPR